MVKRNHTKAVFLWILIWFSSKTYLLEDGLELLQIWLKHHMPGKKIIPNC